MDTVPRGRQRRGEPHGPDGRAAVLDRESSGTVTVTRERSQVKCGTKPRQEGRKSGSRDEA